MLEELGPIGEVGGWVYIEKSKALCGEGWIGEEDGRLGLDARQDELGPIECFLEWILLWVAMVS